MEPSIKLRESRVRRRLARIDPYLRLAKTPTRSWLRSYYGPGYMILKSNTVQIGCSLREYDATLEECESYSTMVFDKRFA